MRTGLLVVLVSCAAIAGSRGVLREAKDAVAEVAELADRSDASCARALGRRASELEETISAVRDEDVSARRALGRARDLADWAERECPRHLARKVGGPVLECSELGEGASARNQKVG